MGGRILALQYLKNFDSREIQQLETDYLVIGGGIAGLATAWSAYEHGAKVTVIMKQSIWDSNTAKAQGGIAAAIGKEDSPAKHMEDTLLAGAGLCNNEAVELVVTEGVERIQELIKLGVEFDQQGEEIALAREGCHSQARVLHANGDATGAEIIRGLREKIINIPEIEMIEYQLLVDLLVEEQQCYGALVWDCKSQVLRIYKSPVVVLATGGVGQLYAQTTNPKTATADGIAAAWRAGAELMDMEFVQFHPTALAIAGAPNFLISEALRGEGAILKNLRHERFMKQYHKMAELAPRDVVTKAIFSEMKKNGGDHVFLDSRQLNPEKIIERFPMIASTCLGYGIDITREPIPIAPVAHYMMGGVKINQWGETNIAGLFACGECSCLGTHGANRLASNSLLEGLVIGERIGRLCTSYIKSRGNNKRTFVNTQLKSGVRYDYGKIRSQLQKIMNQKVGPLRTESGLFQAVEWFTQQEYLIEYEAESVLEIEVRNMLSVGGIIAKAANRRRESRGGHFRQDYPEAQEKWCKHISYMR